MTNVYGDQAVSKVRTIECQQTLHGYGNGHQLLASSATLPRAARAAMLLLSDLSGPSIVKGFEVYTTGYPIPEEGLFALSRTWYAPEMPRPGCVWTHTLLIPVATLALVPSIGVLSCLFSRPSDVDQKDNFQRYSRRLALDPGELPLGSSLDKQSSDVARGIIAALYGNPEACVVVPASDALKFEGLVFALWSQQWPRLRRAFSFCTGSLGRRGGTDFEFDLQIVPESVLRQFQREAKLFVLLNVTSTERGSEDSWVASALHDLESPSPTPLRQFLWSFGPDETDGRTAFQRLCRVREILETPSPPRDRVQRMIHFFYANYLKIDAGLRLKSFLFSYPHGLVGGSTRPIEEQCAVSESLVRLLGQVVPVQIVNLHERGRSLAEASASEAVLLVDRIQSEPEAVYAVEFVRGAAETLTPLDVFVSSIRDSTVARLVTFNPALAASPLAWRASAGRQRAVVRALEAHGSLRPAVLTEIAQMSLEEASDLVMETDFGAAGKWPKAQALLEWASETSRPDAGATVCRWKGLLAQEASAVLEWLEARLDLSAVVTFAAALVLEPAASISKFAASFWATTPQMPLATVGRAEANRAASFVLRKALETPEHKAARAVTTAFRVVYQAAEEDALSTESWAMLSPVLPGAWWSWDRCQRLVEGTVQHFARCSWGHKEFVETFEKRQLLARALRFAKWDWAARSYFFAICEAFHRGELAVTEPQSRAFRDAC